MRPCGTSPTLRDLPCRRIEADEIHSFCYARRKNVPPERAGQFGYGDIRTWVAIDPETKLVVSWLLGDREAGAARAFMRDLASRLSGRIQLTTDGLRKYPDAVEVAFGGDVDYAALVKDFATDKEARSIVHQGNPDPERITTSYIERQNPTMRMGIRRYTRRTNAFSKKIENHCQWASKMSHFWASKMSHFFGVIGCRRRGGLTGSGGVAVG